MRKVTITMATAVLMLGSMAMAANAQTQAGAASMHSAAQNATVIKEAACHGFGRWCPPGFVRACGPYRCWCRPCW